MSVYRLYWNDGSNSYISVDDRCGDSDAMRLLETIGAEKINALETWHKIQLEMNPCGDAIILQYGRNDHEDFAIPVRRLI